MRYCLFGLDIFLRDFKKISFLEKCVRSDLALILEWFFLISDHKDLVQCYISGQTRSQCQTPSEVWKNCLYCLISLPSIHISFSRTVFSKSMHSFVLVRIRLKVFCKKLRKSCVQYKWKNTTNILIHVGLLSAATEMFNTRNKERSWIKHSCLLPFFCMHPSKSFNHKLIFPCFQKLRSFLAFSHMRSFFLKFFLLLRTKNMCTRTRTDFFPGNWQPP